MKKIWNRMKLRISMFFTMRKMRKQVQGLWDVYERNEKIIQEVQELIEKEIAFEKGNC